MLLPDFSNQPTNYIQEQCSLFTDAEWNKIVILYISWDVLYFYVLTHAPPYTLFKETIWNSNYRHAKVPQMGNTIPAKESKCKHKKGKENTTRFLPISNLTVNEWDNDAPLKS